MSSVVFKVSKSVDGSITDVKNAIYFPRYQKILSSSGSKISAHDFETGLIEKVFEEHTGVIHHMIKYDEDIFLSCSEDSTIREYSLSEMRNTRTFDMNKSPVLQILKLRGKDCFISVNKNGELKVINYPENELVRDLLPHKVCESTKIVNSRSHENSLYINTSKAERNKVKLFDYVENKATKIFRKHRCEILSVAVFKNNMGEEMVLLGGADSFLYVYNTTFPKYRSSLIKRIQILDRPTSMFCYGDSRTGDNRLYAFIGTSGGRLELHDFCSTKENRYKKIGEHQIHRKRKSVLGISFVKFTNPTKTITIVTSSDDETMKIVEIEGIKYVNEEEEVSYELRSPTTPSSPLTRFVSNNRDEKKKRRGSCVISMDDSDDEESPPPPEEEEEDDDDDEDNEISSETQKLSEEATENNKGEELPSQQQQQQQKEEKTEETKEGQGENKVVEEEEEGEEEESEEEKKERLMALLQEFLEERKKMSDVLQQRLLDKDKIIEELKGKIRKVKEFLV